MESLSDKESYDHDCNIVSHIYVKGMHYTLDVLTLSIKVCK